MSRLAVRNTNQKLKSSPAVGNEKYPVKTLVLESARLCPLTAGKDCPSCVVGIAWTALSWEFCTAWTALRCWIVWVEGARCVRKGLEWVIWVTAGTAETNLAVDGVKGAVAMMRDCWGWEIGDDLGTGASVTGSIVVVSKAGVSVVSSYWTN